MFIILNKLIYIFGDFSISATNIVLQFILSTFLVYILNYVVRLFFNEYLPFDDNFVEKPRIPQMKMIKVAIPFTFKLLDNKSGEIVCKISSQMDYKLFLYWGVSIRDFHLFLWEPWNTIYTAAEQGILLEGCYQQSGIHYSSEMHDEEIFQIKIPETPLDLGTPPRHKYPLVVLILAENTSEIANHAVALISIVHIKDLVCTLPTSILAQYLKEANGQLSCLKQLYMANGDSVNHDPEISDQLCIICQHHPISRALLPCRHTCICALCFLKLDRCPMCRSAIASYFCIRIEDYITENRNLNKSKIDLIINWFNKRLGYHQ